MKNGLCFSALKCLTIHLTLSITQDQRSQDILCHNIPPRGRSITTWTRRGGQVVQKCIFLSTFKIKSFHMEVGVGMQLVKKGKNCVNECPQTCMQERGEIFDNYPLVQKINTSATKIKKVLPNYQNIDWLLSF